MLGRTFSKPWWIIVDVGEGDVDEGGSSQTPQLSAHIFGLDHDLVRLFDLSVHVG